MVVHLQTMLNQVCYRGSLERLDTEIRVIDKREPEVGYIRSEIREIREILEGFLYSWIQTIAIAGGRRGGLIGISGRLEHPKNFEVHPYYTLSELWLCYRALSFLRWLDISGRLRDWRN